jgi:hypothetical protein
MSSYLKKDSKRREELVRLWAQLGPLPCSGLASDEPRREAVSSPPSSRHVAAAHEVLLIRTEERAPAYAPSLPRIRKVAGLLAKLEQLEGRASENTGKEEATELSHG